jgi:hypothetical protein
MNDIQTFLAFLLNSFFAKLGVRAVNYITVKKFNEVCALALAQLFFV